MRDQDKENIENEPMELVPEETPAVKKKKVPAKKKADPAAPAGEQKKSAELKKAARPKKSGDRNYEVSVKVTNTSDTFSGKYSVPIYISKPYGDYARLLCLRRD